MNILIAYSIIFICVVFYKLHGLARFIYTYSSPTLAPTKLLDTITLCVCVFFLKTKHIGESRISRRFQIWSQIWHAVTIKNIDFFVFNLRIN
jgi:hypothetical protein